MQTPKERFDQMRRIDALAEELMERVIVTDAGEIAFPITTVDIENGLDLDLVKMVLAGRNAVDELRMSVPYSMVNQPN